MTQVAARPAARKQKRHLPTRTATAVAFGALFAVTLSPASAAVATVFLAIACFAYERFQAKLFVPLTILAAIFHLIPWFAAGLLVFLYLLGVGLMLVVADLGTDFVEEDAYNRRLSSAILADWLPKPALILGTSGVGIATGSWTGLAEAAVPAFLALKRHYGWSLATVAVCVGVFGLSPPLLVPAAIALLAIAWSRTAYRAPELRYPLPGAPLWSPLFATRLWRLDSAIKHGRMDDVARLLSGAARTAEQEVLLDLRRILVALEERRFQAALDVITAQDGVGRRLPAMALLHASTLTAIGRPEEGLSLLDAEADRPTGRLAVSFKLARAEAHLEAGHNAEARACAEQAIARSGRRSDSGDRFRAHRLVIESLLRQGLLDEARSASQRGLAGISNYWWSRLGQGNEVERMLLGARGQQMLEFARLLAVTERVAVTTGTTKPEHGNDAGESEDLSTYFAMSGAWRDFADTELRRARLLLERAEPDHAIDACLRALGELDRRRYELRSQRDRAAWSRRMRDALALALEIAERREDATLLAELLELARIQALPLLKGVTDSSDLDIAPAPVIRVRGRTHIARFADPRRPAPVDLELAAMDAAGFGAWSLSFWQANDRVYWSVLPPTGDTYAGTVASASGTPLADALEELRRALPASIEGESAGAFDLRMARSPLLSDPIAEWQLSTKLARLLLPEPLCDELTRRVREGAPPLPLAISPAPQLGFVPWSMLVVNPVARGRSPSRLLHYADWVLAPSASLSATLGSREGVEGPLPLRLAVVDTRQDRGLEALEGARTIAEALPPSIELLGGRHWSDRLATKTAVLDSLRRCEHRASAVFACHALRGHEEMPSLSGLVLADESSGDHESLLSAADLFALASSGASVPAQIYLQACDTSDLASSAAGEWLTIAPGFLVAGAQQVCTTLFPLLDSESAADPVVRALIEGADLRRAVRELQSEAAERWDDVGGLIQARSGNSPLLWAAYAVSAANQTPAGERKVFARSAFPESDGVVSPRTRLTLARATKTMREMHGTRLSTADVMAEYLDAETMMTEGAAWRGLGVALALPLLGRLAGLRHHAQPIGALAATDELLSCLRQARAEAELEGRALEIEHVIRVASRERSAAQRLLEILDGARIQRRAQIANVVDSNLAEQLIRPRSMIFAPGPRVTENFEFVDELLKAASDSGSTARAGR